MADPVFWGVLAARFLVPLLIPRYPLPGILGALLLACLIGGFVAIRFVF